MESPFCEKSFATDLSHTILQSAMDSKLAKLQTALASAIHGMTLEELSRHPQGRWSTAEILDHLNLTYTGTIKNLERGLAAGKPRASPDRSSKRWQRLVVTGLGYFPSGRKSPSRVEPRGTPPQQLTAEIIENIARMEIVLHECETRFGKRRPIADHPVLGPLTIAEWRKFHLVHGKHHAKQILKLRENR